MLRRIERYRKAAIAFISGLGGIWLVVKTADFSTREGAWASIVAIATAIFVYIVPNEP